MSIASFTHRQPLSKLILRNGAIEELRAELALLGISHPMVLAGARTRESQLHARVRGALADMPYEVSPDVPAHSSVELVERIASVARDRQVDGLIAVGGGSASDTAKAVAILLAEGGRLADHAVRFTPPAKLVAPLLRKPKLAIVSIPSTASGAEVTPSLGVRDLDGRKLLFTDFQVASRLVLIDPQANLEMPASVMLSTGMNGLAHCLEGLYSKERSPLAETVATDALQRFAKALPAVRDRPGDASARAELLYAAHLSGLVLVNARTCLHHAICHAIGSVTGASHGDANSVMLPHAIGFNAKAAAEPLARAAHSLGLQDAAELLRWLRRQQGELAVPTRLRDIGIAHDCLPRIAGKVMGERGIFYNPRPVADAQDVLSLLEAAY